MAARSITRNVTVAGHRTSIRMEPSMWEALNELSDRENKTVHEICTLVSRYRSDLSLTAAIRVFIVSYFRTAATEEGHDRAGHGQSPLAVLAARSGLARES